MLWEALTGARLFPGESELKAMVLKVLSTEPDPPSRYVAGLPPDLEALVMRGLKKDPADRTQTAREMARSLQKVVPVAPASDVADWVQSMAGTVIGERARRVAIIEQMTPTNITRASLPPLPPMAARAPSATTLTALSGRRRPLLALAAAVLVAFVATVVITRAQSRATVRATSRPTPSAAPAGSVQVADVAVPAARASLVEPAPTDRSPVVVTTTLAPTPVAPAQPIRSAAAQPAPRKRAAGGEFDHVMDSRK